MWRRWDVLNPAVTPLLPHTEKSGVKVHKMWSSAGPVYFAAVATEGRKCTGGQETKILKRRNCAVVRVHLEGNAEKNPPNILQSHQVSAEGQKFVLFFFFCCIDCEWFRENRCNVAARIRASGQCKYLALRMKWKVHTWIQRYTCKGKKRKVKNSRLLFSAGRHCWHKPVAAARDITAPNGMLFPSTGKEKGVASGDNFVFHFHTVFAECLPHPMPPAIFLFFTIDGLDFVIPHHYVVTEVSFFAHFYPSVSVRELRWSMWRDSQRSR